MPARFFATDEAPADLRAAVGLLGADAPLALPVTLRPVEAHDGPGCACGELFVAGRPVAVWNGTAYCSTDCATNAAHAYRAWLDRAEAKIAARLGLASPAREGV
jgi:hypothetical protein